PAPWSLATSPPWPFPPLSPWPGRASQCPTFQFPPTRFGRPAPCPSTGAISFPLVSNPVKSNPCDRSRRPASAGSVTPVKLTSRFRYEISWVPVGSANITGLFAQYRKRLKPLTNPNGSVLVHLPNQVA